MNLFDSIGNILSGISVLSILCTTSLLVPITCTYYDYNPVGNVEKVLLGLASVLVGQISTIGYFFLYKHQYLLLPLNPNQSVYSYDFCRLTLQHLMQPEGFLLLGTYLFSTYVWNYLPSSYYQTTENIYFGHVLSMLLIQDGLQYIMHRLQHKVHPMLYRVSHKPHHKHRNPILFNAFDGSLTDTCIMIVIPLYITSNVVHANVWSYMTFGTMYANMLVWIHSEYCHPWEPLFRWVYIGTSGDHHVHHKFYKYNFGHLFMYWDLFCDTYRQKIDS